MHKRTKNVLLGTAGLVVTLAPGVLAASQPVVSAGLVTIAGAEEVSNVTATGSLTAGNENTPYAYRNTWNMDIKVNQRVKAGDTLKIKGEGVTLESMNGRDVKSSDGKVIGKFRTTKNWFVSSGSEEIKLETLNEVLLGVTDLNAIPDKYNKIPVDQGLQMEGEIVFNDEAAKYEKLDINIGATNERIVNVLSNRPATFKARLLVAGKPVAERTINKPKQDPTSARVFAREFGESASSVNSADLSNGVISFQYQPSVGGGIKKGETITYSLPAQFGARFKTDKKDFQQGQTLSSTHGRSVLEGISKVLPSGAYVFKSTPLSYKVVELTPDRLKIEILTDYDENFEFKFPITVTRDTYNKATNRLELGSLTETTSAGIDGGKTKVHNVVLPVSGNSLAASGVKIQTKTTQWADEATKESIKGSKIGAAFEGAGTVPGYQFVRTELSKDGTVTTHWFKKDPNANKQDDEITTSFLEDGTGKSLKGTVKDRKETAPGTIEGYQFVRTEKNGKTVIHWFKKKEDPKPAEKPKEEPKKPETSKPSEEKPKEDPKKPETKQPNTRYVDEDGKVIEEVPGSQDKKEIPGYTYLRTNKDKDGNITHVYHKIVTRFVTDKGVTLKQVDGAQPKEEIEGYEFVETKTDKKTGDVTHTYREVTPTAEPFTILKDDKGNILKTTKGTHDPEDLPGYKFLRTEKDKDGNTVHIYHKIVTQFVTVKDGKEEVLKIKDGAQPKEEIDGYEFVETKTDEKTGDIKHYYKVKIVASAEKNAPVQTAGNAGMMLLPTAAVLGLGGLVAGLAKRKKD